MRRLTTKSSNIAKIVKLVDTVSYSMVNWLRIHLADVSIRPLLNDIETGKVRPSAVLLAIQQLSDDEKQQMKPALDQVLEKLKQITSTCD